MQKSSKKPQSKKESKFHLLKGSDWFDLKDVQNFGSGHNYDDIYIENEEIKLMRKVGGIFINDAFLRLWDETIGLLFLDGGYGSSKTTYAITRLLVKCLEHDYFKCFYGRQKKTEARELHSNIIREIKRNNWEHLFDFSEKPNGTTKITCIENGNCFELFGCDDVDSLKGIDNPTDILIDEINQLSFEAFGMLWTRLRTPGCELQLTGCFNNCDVMPDHWLVKYIYGEEDATEETESVLLDALRKSNIVRHHSTYRDNWFQNQHAYYQKLVIKAGGDDKKIKAYCEGEWGVQLDAQPYYKKFNQEKVVESCIYNPTLPLEISWDENVNPYLPVIIAQIEGNKIRVIAEIAAKNPYNTLDWVCAKIMEMYPVHKAGVNIYGDATSKKEDVKQEKGKNFFTLIEEGLKDLFPRLRVPDSNPNNAIRGNFMNLIFGTNYQGIEIKIDPSCKTLINDLQNCPESPDGKGKDKTKTMVNGIRGVQRWGHFGDCLDYLMCEAFMWAYLLFQSGTVYHQPSGGGRNVRNGLDDKPLISTEDKEIMDGDDFEEIEELMNYKRSTRNHMS